MTDSRWFGVGKANGDAVDAGTRAADEALQGRDAELVIVFCSDTYDLEALVSTVAERVGGASLIGCTTAGEIATAGPGDASVVVSALGGPGFSVSTALA